MSVFRLVLKPRGYIVIEHQTAETAVRCTEFIDLLIADVTPPCSGIHVASQLMAWAVPGLRIILTAGHPSEMSSEQQRAALAEIPSDSVRVLWKPFYPGELMAWLKTDRVSDGDPHGSSVTVLKITPGPPA